MTATEATQDVWSKKSREAPETDKSEYKPKVLDYEQAKAVEAENMRYKGIDKSAKSGIIKSGIKIDMQFLAEKDIERQESNSLKRAIRNYNKRIKEHEEYLKNPYEHCPEWDNYEERKKNGLIRHWEKEISNFEKSIEDRIKELKKRGDYDE